MPEAQRWSSLEVWTLSLYVQPRSHVRGKSASNTSSPAVLINDQGESAGLAVIRPLRGESSGSTRTRAHTQTHTRAPLMLITGEMYIL